MSTEEPTTIDEKKAEEDGTIAKEAQWPEFFAKFGGGIVTGILMGVVFIGSTGLFLTKIADANILPTDINSIPYTPGKTRNVPVDLIYINPVKNYEYFGLGFWDKPTSYNIQEANFYNPDGLDFVKDFKNTWLCSLLAKSAPKDAFKSAIWTFEYNSLAANLCMSFTIMQKIFFYLNYLPEWGTMMLFALFFWVIILVINACNIFYSIFSHISHISDLFYHVFYPKSLNSNDEDNHGFSWLFACFWFYVYLIIAGCSAILSPFFITLYTFYKALGANYYVRTKDPQNPPQKMNLFNFIKNVIYYKKTFIIILAMFNLISAANEYLGSSYMPGVVIAIIILIFGMKILVTEVPEELFAVNSDAIFPSLSQKDLDNSATEIDLCSGTVPKTDVSAQAADGVGVTGQPYNVLATPISQTGGKMKGGRGVKKMYIPKVKMYNIQLV